MLQIEKNQLKVYQKGMEHHQVQGLKKMPWLNEETIIKPEEDGKIDEAKKNARRSWMERY